MKLTTTQVRKYFHNLNQSGDKYRANIAHQAIRLLQADDAPAAARLLASIGFQTMRETPAKLKPRLDSIYAVSLADAKAYNETHKQSQITGIEKAQIWGQPIGEWRLDATGKNGKIVDGRFVASRVPAHTHAGMDVACPICAAYRKEPIQKRDSIQTFVAVDKVNVPHIQSVTVSNQKPAKRFTRIRSLASVLTRAMQLLETAQFATSAKSKMRQITRARKMLRFVETALPMQAEYRQRFAATLALATRMENSLMLAGKLKTATLIPQGIEMPDVPVIKIVAL